MFLTAVVVFYFLTSLESTNLQQAKGPLHHRHQQTKAAVANKGRKLALHVSLSDATEDESVVRVLPFVGLSTPPSPQEPVTIRWNKTAQKMNRPSISAPSHTLVTSSTSSSKLSNSLQTVNNVTFLLNNLLKQYDNSLRPDLGGEISLYITNIVHHV